MLQLSSSLEENLAALNARFGASADFYAKRIELYHCPGAIVLFDNMASLESLWSLLLDAATRHTPSLEPERMPHSGTQVYELLMHHSGLPAEDSPVKDMDDLIRRMTAGMAVLLLDGCKKGIAFSVQGLKSRSVEEPSGEGNLRGSREGFTESNNTNTAMVRRRLKSPNLTVETLYLGRQSRTNVRLCYLSDVAAPETVEAVRQKLREASLPLVLDSGFLQAFIGKGAASLFSGTGTTQRPDTLCAKLAEGRVGVMVDGSPNVMIAPYLFTEHFHTLDDYTQRPYFTAFVRLLRLAAFFLTVLLPGYYVAVVTFHPERIPRMLLPAFLGSVSATPLSAMGEALALFLLYELLREAGLRLPDAIGHTLSVVGGIVIGDAIVTAGLVGLPMIIIIALTAVSAFAVPSLYEPVTILRFLFIFIGGILGLYGMVLGFLVLVVNLCGLHTLGTPLTAPIAPWQPRTLRDLFWRSGWQRLGQEDYTVSSARQRERGQTDDQDA